jgi:hypothetical protein
LSVADFRVDFLKCYFVLAYHRDNLAGWFAIAAGECDGEAGGNCRWW